MSCKHHARRNARRKEGNFCPEVKRPYPTTMSAERRRRIFDAVKAIKQLRERGDEYPE